MIAVRIRLVTMANHPQSNWLTGALSAAAGAGFQRAYREIRINEARYLRRVRRAHHLPIESWSQMFELGPEVVDPIAWSTIRASARLAALEGMGLGIGSFLTVLPDMGFLAAVTLRMLQKLSLLYGFEYATEEETVSLWIAAATAAGVDLGRDFVEKQAVDRLVPRIVDSIAVKVGEDVAEKWAGRLVPVLSVGFGGAINYYFVRSWGRRAQKHFTARHLLTRSRMDIAHARNLLAAPAPSLSS